ncbi:MULTISPECIES: HGxxPAAW family protein [Actinomadura]|uniref:HGxxPAAW family protein n=1 Tax=Actinomadura TaxID=1988 RepID=UPI001FE42066|nr:MULTISPECIES: HGxxPAAW family protein [Actinomadura]
MSEEPQTGEPYGSEGSDSRGARRPGGGGSRASHTGESNGAARAESHGSHAGRPGSWVAVTIIFAGFVVGGVAICLGPAWIMFYVGVGIIVVGMIVSGLVHLFSDVVVDAPRVIPEIVDYSLFGSRSDKRRGGEQGEAIDRPIATDPQQTPHG